MCLNNGDCRQLTEFGRGVREGRRLQEILPEPVTGPAASQGDAVVSRRCLACRLWFEGDWCDWCWQPDSDDETDGRRLSDFGRGVREGNRRCRLTDRSRELVNRIIMAEERLVASQGANDVEHPDHLRPARHRWSFHLMTRRGDLIAEVHNVNDLIDEFIQRMDEGVSPGVPSSTLDLDGTLLTSCTSCQLEWDGRLLDDFLLSFISDLGISQGAELTVQLMVAHPSHPYPRPFPRLEHLLHLHTRQDEEPEVTTIRGPKALSLLYYTLHYAGDSVSEPQETSETQD